MSNTIIKKIEIQHPTTNIEVDIGAEAQSITVSRNASGEIITDLDTEIVDSIETLAETLKEGESPFTGATASANGTKGLVPQPVAGDENKCLFGDATWRESINGSSITITSLEASLNGKQVSISDGTHTKTGTFDASGICTITGITFVGNLTITSTDGTETATKIVNMPYFGVYTTTLSFWAATVNITGSDELKGALVTVKNSSDVTVGTVTLSSTDATGVFVASEADTYKFNFTYGGKNYSEELEITAQTTYNLSLSVGFDWKEWVDSSKTLHSTDYDSLSEVLADEEAVRQLFLVHDCVDYMAETTSVNTDIQTIINNDLCAKWINLSDYALDTLYANTIIKSYMDTADKYFYGEWVNNNGTWGPKGNVPVMTANNAPYGEASATSQYSSDFAAWKVFNGIIQAGTTNYWSCANNQVTNQRIVYKFANPICVRRFSICNANNATRSANHVKLQYSNDGTTWNDADSTIFENPSTAWQTTAFTAASTQYALYWGVLIIDNHGATNEINVVELQFYGRELSVSVPGMNTATTPFGEVSASYYVDTNYPWNVFNNNNLNWASNSTNQWLQYDFGKPMVLKVVLLKSIYATVVRLKNFKILGSNDGVDFAEHELFSGTYPSDSSASTVVNAINNSDAYRYIRISVADTYSSSSNIVINMLQFYGFDYSEKEFEEGTTKKWLYDHGVELETLVLYTTGASGVVAEKHDNYIELMVGSTEGQAKAGCTVNLTNYNLIRAKVGDELYDNVSPNNIYFGCATSQTASQTSYVSVDPPLASLQLSLDISNITGNMYVNLGAGYKKSKSTWKELWLE